MKKRVLATVLAAIMGLSMTACGGGNATSNEGDAAPATESGTKEADSASDEDVTIRFYNYALSEAAKADWWENTISNFEKENPNITIDTVTVDYNSMVSTFTNDIASGLSVDTITK